jgi:hypothetical protein
MYIFGPTRTLIFYLWWCITVAIALPPALFITVPDTQNLATSYPWALSAQGAWVKQVAGSWKTRNVATEDGAPIPFIGHLGDAINHAHILHEWERAQSAFFDVSVSPGNHEWGGPAAAMNALSTFDMMFPLPAYLTNGHIWNDWGYLSSYPPGTRRNTAFLIKRPFPVVVYHVQYLPWVRETERAGLEAWARNISDSPVLTGIPAIIYTHHAKCAGGTVVPLFMSMLRWTRARLAFAGHCAQTIDGGDYTSPGIDITPSHAPEQTYATVLTTNTATSAPPWLIVADYQSTPQGGNGRVRFVMIHDTRFQHICVWTWSPVTARLDTALADTFEIHEHHLSKACKLHPQIVQLILPSTIRTVMLFVMMNIMGWGLIVWVANSRDGHYNVSEWHSDIYWERSDDLLKCHVVPYVLYLWKVVRRCPVKSAPSPLPVSDETTRESVVTPTQKRGRMSHTLIAAVFNARRM